MLALRMTNYSGALIQSAGVDASDVDIVYRDGLVINPYGVYEQCPFCGSPEVGWGDWWDENGAYDESIWGCYYCGFRWRNVGYHFEPVN